MTTQPDNNILDNYETSLACVCCSHKLILYQPQLLSNIARRRTMKVSARVIFQVCMFALAYGHMYHQEEHHLSKRDADSTDACMTEDVGNFEPTMVVGSCPTFNGQRCLCELNANCDYDLESKNCTDAIDCSLYERQSTLCRRHHCFYDCTTGQCTRNDEQKGSCGSSCGQFCNDICKCNAMGCQYSSSGFCGDSKEIVCSDSAFKENECGRPNGFYVKDGTLCKNVKSRGNCVVEKTVFAINMGGLATTDSDGIVYTDEKSLNYIDDAGIRSVAVNPAASSHPDSALLQYIVYANTFKRESGRCISYSIPVCQDGIYELRIKTIEIFDVLPGEKTFNIKLGEKFIFSEVDVPRIAGERFVPVDLVTNFRITNGMIILDGGETVTLTNNTVPLKFCFGECMFAEGSFEIAAFSVVKFADVTSRHCALFNGDHWECLSESCDYNTATGICSARKNAGCTEERPTCGPPELDMLFLLDASSSLPGPVESRVFDAFQRISKVADSLSVVFPKSKYGISLFSDFSCTDWNSCKPRPSGLTGHDEKEGCYRRQQVLTQDLTTFYDRAQRNQLTYLHSEEREPGLFGAMLAAQDRAVNWTVGNPSLVKVIVLISDDGLHRDYPGDLSYKHQANFDGGDSCWGTKHPPVSALDSFFAREKISLFFLLNTAENEQSYDSVLQTMKVPHDYGRMGETANQIAKQLTKFVFANDERDCRRNGQCDY